MKIAATVLAIVLLPSLVRPQIPSAQNTQQQDLFASFYHSLNEITENLGNKSGSLGGEANIHQLLNKITGNVKFLESMMTSDKPIPKEYLESLALDLELLKKYAAQKPKNRAEQEMLYEGLQEVDSDLTVKANHIKGGRGGGASLVQVLVRSKKDAQDVAGYEVWYVPKGWAADSLAFKRFDRLTDASNPPEMNLAPGNYFLWLSKGQPLPGRQPISLGGDGKAKREIDLTVP
jgi:hypothetical protein